MTSTSALFYSIWQDPPLDIYMQFYFWNVTNANDVINNGAKPNVALAGPYSYLEKRIKWGIEWSNNSEVMTYRYNRTFT